MSVKVSSWVWHGDETAELAGNEMILLLALADVADDGGRCRFMQDEHDLAYASLAKKARVSVRTVATLVGKLRDAGLLEHTRGTKSQANEFRIVVPWAKDANSASNAERGSMQPPADSMQPATRSDATTGNRSSLIRTDVNTRTEAAQKRGTRIPDDFAVTPEMVSWARERCPLVDGARSTERFINYWASKSGKDATKLDWVRTWQNWMLRDQEQAEQRQQSRPTPAARAQSVLDMGRAMDARASAPERLAVSS